MASRGSTKGLSVIFLKTIYMAAKKWYKIHTILFYQYCILTIKLEESYQNLSDRKVVLNAKISSISAMS